MKRQITYSESLKLGEENICSKADIIDNSSSKPNWYKNQEFGQLLLRPEINEKGELLFNVLDDEMMPKIYKDIFNQNPERFELRIDYPDMPACPFGNSFKALGFDKEKREYVWMVTSIIKDDRLKKVVYAK